MKKTFFILTLIFSVAILFAQKSDHMKPATIHPSVDIQESTLLQSHIADCINPKSLKASYALNCKSIDLSWITPTEILWDNVKSSNSGYPSFRYLDEEGWYNALADDFVLEPGQTFIITDIAVNGFYTAASGNFVKPDYMGFEIFEDNGNKLPGNRILDHPYLLTGAFTVPNGTATYTFPEPFIIDVPGRYWLSYYGTYLTSCDSCQFYDIAFDEPIGEPAVIHSGTEADATWQEHPATSIYFRIIGRKSDAPFKYNIYRDQERVAENVTELFYTDILPDGFDVSVKHTWAVTAVCPTGDESDKVNNTILKCTSSGGINENDISFMIVPNPANDFITVTSSNLFDKIEMINFLGQTVFSQQNVGMVQTTFDVSNLNSGVYFIRLISETGTSIQKFVKK
jgi:hypothetical protein